MIYYFLPDAGIFGGVKVACRFVDLLNELGAPAVAVFPDGRAPGWFRTRAPVLSEAEAFARLGARDWSMFTWPPDYDRLRRHPARLVNHCQGTDPRMDRIFADPEVLVLTCWQQATDHVRSRRIGEPVEVGIAVESFFFAGGDRRGDTRVAYMPRRGNPLVRACMRRVGGVDFLPIDGCEEREVARRMRSAGIFLATAEGEQFGLPALEAMAAGCVVLSVPVRGGMEYLRDGENCLMAPAEELPDRLAWIAHPARARERARLRHAAVATAVGYRRSRQARRLARLLAGPLAELRA